MTLLKLLNSRSNDYDCSIIIGEVEVNADIVWDSEDRITQEGYLRFRKLLDCEATYDAERNFIDVPNGNPDDGYEFTAALAGYVSDKCYRTWFSEYGECAPTECSKCDRKECIHCEAYRRLLKRDGGLELCPLFDE